MPNSVEQVVRILAQCLREGYTVDIDGLGIFRPTRHGYEFQPRTAPRVFLAYVREDLEQVERLYRALRRRGYDPWLDRKKLLPGQDWPRAIQRAIELADFFIACFSSRAVRKRGEFQSELRYALECARRLPLDELYLLPVRLDDCAVPARVSREIQYVDLFPDWHGGIRRLVAALESARSRRPKAA
ncbi:MAG: TIR domain-containing protein [Bryobacterales bacterium]|nr:toll/interleukin-1 receptor domain-containing protein [Bryobacteraceae bacterium]MDW8356016.1 TIR domain-containing protein [Bryobacterales bacterium]